MGLLVWLEVFPFGCVGFLQKEKETHQMVHPGGKSARALIRPPGLIEMSKPTSSRVLVCRKAMPAVGSGSRVRKVMKAVSNQQNKKRVSVIRQPAAMKRTVVVRTLASRSSSQPELGRLARGNKLTVLERRSVSKAIEEQYGNYYQKFLSFCQEQGLDLPPSASTDANLADYMDVLFFEGKPMNEGEKILASVEFHHGSLKGKLVRSRKALRGWRKERPPESRVPLPKLVAYGLCMILLAKGKRLHALKLILDLDTYMRPGESHDLLKKNLVVPVSKAGPQYKWYAIVIRDFDELRPDKVGIFDNSIPLNSRERTWIGDVLHQHVRTLPKKDSKIFPFDAADFRQEMSAAGERLRLVGLHPYQLRHGGAADDLNAKERDHQGVKSRGRWQTDQSVRRYTKVGKIQQILNQLSPANLAYCRWSHRNLFKAFSGKVAPKLN